MSSLDQLGHIFFLTLCIVSLFGVVGVLLWSGRFTGRCAPVDDETGEVLSPTPTARPGRHPLHRRGVQERLKLCNVRYEDEFEVPLLKRCPRPATPAATASVAWTWGATPSTT